MTGMKRVAQATAAVGVSAVAFLALAPQASAAPAAAKAAYNGACGTGYKVVNSTPVGDTGTAYLTYSSATGENCAVAVRHVTGDAVPMELFIRRSDSEIYDDYDGGDFRSYVGPVHVRAAGSCVDWWGSIDGVRFGRYATNCG
ncbi:spore-associated protein A [Streptomyces sp. NPDC029080]|uniref:spore-associated protein A n=1 Tax=unclassified Streptomyces TaxID=2593676 RepID=UPI001F31F08F|nr:spore-associated protein A [Streptomyces sp. SID486]